MCLSKAFFNCQCVNMLEHIFRSTEKAKEIFSPFHRYLSCSHHQPNCFFTFFMFIARKVEHNSTQYFSLLFRLLFEWIFCFSFLCIVLLGFRLFLGYIARNCKSGINSGKSGNSQGPWNRYSVNTRARPNELLEQRLMFDPGARCLSGLDTYTCNVLPSPFTLSLLSPYRSSIYTLSTCILLSSFFTSTLSNFKSLL